MEDPLSKRFILAAACALLLVTNALAQTSLAGISPKDARSMGMGGTFRVFATGYQAFFGNPAGFSGPGTLTLADAAAWGYFNPNPANVRALVALAQREMSQPEAEETLGRLIAGNGFGGGASLGMGWSGKGIGAGLTLVSDALATGTSYSDASMVVRNQADAVFGVAWPLVLGPFTLNFGIDVRAFYRLDSSGGWSFADLASAYLSDSGITAGIGALAVNGGYGLAVDTGATIEVGALSAGVMVRDYGYKFYMGNSTVGDIAESGAFPLNGENAYSLIPRYSAGLALKFGKGTSLASSFYLEAEDPMNFIAEAQADFEASLELLHIGAELEFLNFITMRAGFNQGLLSLGAGMDFALLELDAALFTEKTSDATSGPGRSGISIQAAIRF